MRAPVANPLPRLSWWGRSLWVVALAVRPVAKLMAATWPWGRTTNVLPFPVAKLMAASVAMA